MQPSFASNGSFDTGSGFGSMWGDIISDISDATRDIIGALRRPNTSTGSGSGTTAYPPNLQTGSGVSTSGIFLLLALLVALYFVFKK